MIAVTDATADAAGDFAVDPYYDPRVWPGAVHNKGANALFCDGHVERYRQRDMIVRDEYDPVRRMWNSDHRINGGISYDQEDGG
jgi:prepilin-type processing-associated H-X9-DG protein